MALTAAFNNKLEAQFMRAINRLNEADFDEWALGVQAYDRQGFVEDVSTAKALDDVYGTVQWRRFRK